MASRNQWARAGALALSGCLLQIGAASAATVTLDFENLAPAIGVAANLAFSGFRLSPNCHYDVLDAQPSYASRWLGLDGSACQPGGRMNPDFLGPDRYVRTYAPDAPPMLWLDHASAVFSLQSVDLVGADYTVLSSKGGSARIRGGPSAPQMHFEFNAPEWTDVAWLIFIVNGDMGVPQGLDNLTLGVPTPLATAVPEPGTRSLLAVALAGLALRSRFSRRQPD